MIAARTFHLTPALLASHVGTRVFALDARAEGGTFPLHAERPGAEINRPLRVGGLVFDSEGNATSPAIDPIGEDGPTVTRVDIRGVIEQRSTRHDPCAAYTDGHDAISERMISALEDGDVFLVIDSPGGDVAGMQEAITRVLATKAEHSRTVIGYADESIGSAAAWWALSVCDELYIPAAGKVGAIGCRGAHASVAGALAIAGVTVTYFAAPGPGKVALAPELPLSDIGAQRANRDVNAACDAFIDAVCSGPVGQRYGITDEALRDLDADSPTGWAAVEFGLADGVCSIEDAMARALGTVSAKQLAKSSDEARANGASSGANDDAAKSAAREFEMKIGGKDPKAGEGEGSGTKCGNPNCGADNPMGSHFCAQCGTNLAPKPAPEEETAATPAPAPPAPKDDAAPKEGAPPPPKPAPPPAARASAMAGVHASYAAIAGLSESASVPAIKGALAAKVSLANLVMARTDTKDPAAAEGALDRIIADASEVHAARTERDQYRAESERQERITILDRLVLRGDSEHTRGKLFVDVVRDGKIVGRKPAPLWSDGPEGRTIENLRGYAQQVERTPAAAKSTPFEPSESAAKDANGEGVTEADRQAAARHGYKAEDFAASRRAIQATNRGIVAAHGNGV